MSCFGGLRNPPREQDPQEPRRDDESWDEMEEKFGQQLQMARSTVDKEQENLELVKKRLDEMEAFYKVKLQKSGLAAMETFYKQKLQKERSALKDKVEELKSFKDRMAGEFALPIKTGNSESMNSPVSETRLKEMYKELWQEWPKIKPLAESQCPDVDWVTWYIQNAFKKGAEKMEEKMKLIERVFDLEEEITGPTSQKVTQYRRLTVQNLQLVLYHSRRGDAAQTKHEDDKTLQCFFARCYWLAGLMALNNPPLQPDWEQHSTGMDRWNIFPRNLRAASAL